MTVLFKSASLLWGCVVWLCCVECGCMVCIVWFCCVGVILIMRLCVCL